MLKSASVATFWVKRFAPKCTVLMLQAVKVTSLYENLRFSPFFPFCGKSMHPFHFRSTPADGKCDGEHFVYDTFCTKMYRSPAISRQSYKNAKKTPFSPLSALLSALLGTAGTKVVAKPCETKSTNSPGCYYTIMVPGKYEVIIPSRSYYTWM